MGLVHRRFPLYVRPLPFFPLVLGGLFATWVGLHLGLEFSRQTGHFFLLLSLPNTLLAFAPARVALLGLGVFGLVAAFGWGTVRPGVFHARPGASREGLWSPRFRFYPALFLFGLFVLYFGIVFLFDASVAGDNVPGGYVAFVYLNYAGLLDRPVVSAVGFALGALGLLAATRGSFAAGLLPRPARPLPRNLAVAPPAAPSPRSAPAIPPMPKPIPAPTAALGLRPNPVLARVPTPRPPAPARGVAAVPRPVPSRPTTPPTSGAPSGDPTSSARPRARSSAPPSRRA